MKQIFTGIVIIVVLLSVTPAHPFYVDSGLPDALRSDHTTIDMPTQDNNGLMIFDNQLSGRPGVFLEKKNRHFTPALNIPFKMPLNLLVLNSIQPEISLDRILAANLRAKKYYLEYQNLREKALDLIRDNRAVPKTTAARNQPTDRPKSLWPVDNERRVDFNHEEQRISLQLQAAERVISMSQKGSSKQDVILMDNGFTPNRSEKGYLADNLYLPAKKVRYQGGYAGSAAQQSYEVRHVDSELPWIFRVVLTTIKFVGENKIEISLYAMFFMITGYFIILKLKR